MNNNQNSVTTPNSANQGTAVRSSGLSSLIPRGDGAGSGYRDLPVDRISSNVRQPRQKFDESELSTLASSIELVGVLQPIAVRPRANDTYEIISGERRWRAARRVGLTHIPAVIRQISDENSLEHAIMENIHRSNLNPLEEAAAYQHLIDEFHLSQENVATRVGKSRASVTNSLRLLKLPLAIQSYLATEKLTAGHARCLLSLEKEKEQIRVAEMATRENWTVRQIEDYCRKKPAGGKTSRKKSPKKDTAVVDLEDYIANKLSTRVSIVMGGRGKTGKAIIEFADLEDLQRIVAQMVPND